MGPAARLREYHQRTKHSFERIHAGGHFLDWDNEPARFKEYLDLDPDPLPPFRETGVPALASVGTPRDEEGRLDVEALSHILFHAAGTSRAIETSIGPFHFRTYASAGALYPIEVYVVAGDVDGVTAGVYHYAPREHGLHRLRDEDYRAGLGLAGRSLGAAYVVLTGIPWRTSWKYTARGFRHLYWDAGMMLANLLAASTARRIRAEVLLGFVDRDADRLLGVDGRSEFALCAVALGRGADPPRVEVASLDLPVAPLSRRPLADPEIEEAREAIRLEGVEEARAFRQAQPPPSAEPGSTVDVAPLGPSSLSEDPIELVIRRRGSSRRLSGEGFPAAEYAAIAERALVDFPRDWHSPGPVAFVSAHALEGLAPGAYRYVPGRGFDLIAEGSFRARAGHLCLDQRLGADAAATTFLLADLDWYLDALGGRGYAAAQLDAAVAAGRLYLGAYAQCLGASGITFYDDEAREFFRTEAEPMMAVVIGQEGRRRAVIRCRRAREGR